MALKNILAIAESKISEDLQNFLENNLPLQKKKKSFAITLMDNKLAGNIASTLGVECKISDAIFELFRGIRIHFTSFLKKKGIILLLLFFLFFSIVKQKFSAQALLMPYLTCTTKVTPV
jgi:hypothetical protein